MRGGKRIGAGAPKIHPENSKRRQIPMTDEEYKLVLVFMQNLRSKNIEKNKTN